MKKIAFGSMVFNIIVGLIWIVPGESNVLTFKCSGTALQFCPGTSQIVVCTTYYQFVRWTISGYSYIDFDSSHAAGQIFVSGPFTAKLLTNEAGNFTSRVSFTGSKLVSNTTVSCIDGHDGDSEQCTIQQAGVPGVPSNVTILQLNNSLHLSWTPPLSTITINHYTITISPPLQHANCTEGQCNVTTTGMTVGGGIVDNVNYTITVAAVNCVGVGTSIQEIYMPSYEDTVNTVNTVFASSVALDSLTGLNSIQTTVTSYHDNGPSTFASQDHSFSVYSSIESFLVSSTTEPLQNNTGTVNINTVIVISSVMGVIAVLLIVLVLAALCTLCVIKIKRNQTQEETFDMTKNVIYMQMDQNIIYNQNTKSHSKHI